MRTDLLLVRHGQVDAVWRTRIYGCLDVPLSDHGRWEARRAAQFLEAEPVDAVVSSGLSRTRYGAEWIARKRGLEVEHDAGLREIERGDWAGMTFAELAQREPGAIEAWRAAAWTTSPPHGESMGDLAARVTPVLDGLAERFPRGQVAVVAHSHVLRAAIARAVGQDESMTMDLPTGSILALDWTVDGPVQVRWTQLFPEEASE